MAKFLRKATIPVEIDEKSNVADLVRRMGDTAFQGKTLSRAVDVWKAMLKDNIFILMGLAGAMVPAGMRKIIAYCIKNRLIDCLVTTGANLFHDIHETLGNFHYQGHHSVDDTELHKEGVDRIYDVFASEKKFRITDNYIAKFTVSLDLSRPYTTREYFYLLGKKLSKDYDEEGIVSSAARANVPVYCPAIPDSSIGIAIAVNPISRKFTFDGMRDVYETGQIVEKAIRKTGVIYVGGGTPKNFIQQTAVTISMVGKAIQGHKYAVQFITDAPHWGGLSGCTFNEGKSWGKIAERARTVTVFVDATIALPIVVTALAQSGKELIRKRKRPKMKISGRELIIG